MIRAKTEIEDPDKERMDALVRAFSEYPNANVKIGFFRGESAGHYQGDEDVVEIALFNEFGTPHAKHPVPQRSFMGSAIDEHYDQVEAVLAEAFEDLVEGKSTIEFLLDAVGFRIKTLIENKIKSNVPPPNAPATVAAKARDGVAPSTLIHTGLMLRSVQYKVDLGKGAE